MGEQGSGENLALLAFVAGLASKNHGKTPQVHSLVVILEHESARPHRQRSTFSPELYRFAAFLSAVS